ncbi:MAG TPA: hypothetical protein VHJ19_02255 [Gammaproteobacteria bacterium]|nr:hypothetical protein [Gammaproteobacteria bacterium]
MARTILYCVEHPKRDVFVGLGGKFISLLGKYTPRLADKIMEVTFVHLQKSKQPAHRRRSALRTPTFGLRTRGGYPGYVAHSSLYTKAMLHPFITGSIVAGAGLALAELFGRGLSSRQRH